jgi:hypothetical protein
MAKWARPHTPHSCPKSPRTFCGCGNPSFLRRSWPPTQKIPGVPGPLARRLDFYAYKNRSDCHLQSPFCRAMRSPPHSPAARVWLARLEPLGLVTLSLETQPGPTWVAFSRRDPLGFARDLALGPAWLVDRPARSEPTSANSCGVSVRVALSLRFPGLRGSLSQAAPSR